MTESTDNRVLGTGPGEGNELFEGDLSVLEGALDPGG